MPSRVLDAHFHFFPSPQEGVVMGIEEQINPIPALDGAPPIFHSPPPVSRNIHPGAERIIRVSAAMVPSSGNHDQAIDEGEHPRTLHRVPGKESGGRFMGAGPPGRQTAIGPPCLGASAHIAIPEIQLEIGPAAPFPAAADCTAAIGGRVHHAHHGFAGTASQQRHDRHCREHAPPVNRGLIFLP